MTGANPFSAPCNLMICRSAKSVQGEEAELEKDSKSQAPVEIAEIHFKFDEYQDRRIKEMNSQITFQPVALCERFDIAQIK